MTNDLRAYFTSILSQDEIAILVDILVDSDKDAHIAIELSDFTSPSPAMMQTKNIVHAVDVTSTPSALDIALESLIVD